MILAKGLAAERVGRKLSDAQRRIPRPVDRAVTRNDDADVVPEIRERAGKRAHDVREAPDLGERSRLGREHQDPHGGALWRRGFPPRGVLPP